MGLIGSLLMMAVTGFVFGLGLWFAQRFIRRPGGQGG